MNKYTIHIVMMLALLGGCTGSQTLVDVDDIQDSLAPGLHVLFFNGMYRNVRQIPDGDVAILEKGRPVSPIFEKIAMITNAWV